jgi:predicted RND superfamily exporter protein
MVEIIDGMALTRKFVSFIVAKPQLTVVFVTLITIIPLLIPAMHFQDNMTADIEAYLPEGDPATEILKEVRKEWSTDVVIVYVETPNKFDSSQQVNITNRNILLEMSMLEGDDDFGASTGALDWDKNDRGRNDDVVFVLSIAMVIKELNSTYPRLVQALEKQSIEVDEDDDIVHEQGRYAIPSQRRIDELVRQASDSLKSFVVDTNDDGIWDTAAIIVAITHDVDQKIFMERVGDNIKLMRLNHPSGSQAIMTQTGLVVVLNDVTDQIYNDLLKIIPVAVILVILVLIAFHRDWKIVFVAGLPVLLSLIWTFGLLKLSGVTLTPMVVAAAPILIGLSVDDALHVTNRIFEFRKEYGVEDSIIWTYKTTGRAIALTTITTIIGFTTLVISDIIPMRIVGFTLFIGMIAAFVLTIVLVPPMAIATKYFKAEMGMWKSVGDFPVKRRFHIIVVTLVIAMISVYNLSAMSTDIRGDESAPNNIDSLSKIKEYTVEFQAGQTGIIIVRGNTVVDEPVKNLDLLDAVDKTEIDVAKVENTTAMSVVDFFKSMKFNTTYLPEPFKTVFQLSGISYELTAWEIIHFDGLNDQQQRQIIEVFYDTLSNETRSMLINDDYTKTLIYTEMPYVNIGKTKRIVDEVNAAIDLHEDEVPGGSISHLTGGAPVSIAINDGILGTQFKTILLSGVLVFFTLIIAFALPRFTPASLFKSLKIAVIAMIPLIMVVLLQPLLMIGASSNTNIFTAMLGTIIIGIGIDYSVHMSERIHQEGMNFEGIARATRGTGQSMVEASATTIMGVAAGIAVTWHSFAGLRNFFMIISILLAYALLAGLLVLPAIYAVIAGYHKYGGLNAKAFGVPSFVNKEEEDQLFSETTGAISPARESSHSLPHGSDPGGGEVPKQKKKVGISFLKKEPVKAQEYVPEEQILDADSIDWEDAESFDDE